MTAPTPAEVIAKVGMKYAFLHGGFSHYELRQFKKGFRVTPFIEKCFVDLLARYNSNPIREKYTPLKNKKGKTLAEREDIIINLAFDRGQVTADELAAELNLFRDQVCIDLIPLVNSGVLSVVQNGARHNKTYQIAGAGKT